MRAIFLRIMFLAYQMNSTINELRRSRDNSEFYRKEQERRNRKSYIEQSFTFSKEGRRNEQEIF